MITWYASFLFLFFFLKFFFSCGLFLKSLLNLLQYCFCFMFWFFGQEACGILAPRPGIESTLPALEGDVITTGPPRKSQCHFFWLSFSLENFKKQNHSKKKIKIICNSIAQSRVLLIFWFTVSFKHFYYCKIDHDI